MPRRLPWKNGAAVLVTSRKKGKSREQSESGSPESSPPPASRRKRKQSDGDEDDSDHQDDENWRMTESELAATAQLWTRDLHRQAYENLLKVQQREMERSRTLNNLLEQPLAQLVLPALPPRIAEAEPEPQPKPKRQHKAKPETKIQASTNMIPKKTNHALSKEVASSSKALTSSTAPAHEKPSEVEKTHSTSNRTTIESANRPATLKLSEAALARRREREQACKIEKTVVPLF